MALNLRPLTEKIESGITYLLALINHPEARLGKLQVKEDYMDKQNMVPGGAEQSTKESIGTMTKDNEKTKSKLSLLHELYVELLGSLIPGLFTVILGGTSIYLVLKTLATFGNTLFPGMKSPFSPLIGVGGFIGAIHWEIGVAIIVSAYVIGAAFFRQDPKGPDAVSALYVWMNSTKEERSGLAVQTPKELEDTFLFKNADKQSIVSHVVSYFFPRSCIKKLKLDTQFPYLHLRCYLAARGLNHLIRLVPWCPDVPEKRGFRTKMFINIIKIRLLSCFPNMSRDIIRNEAHVRLATSVWYVSITLKQLSIATFIILLEYLLLCWHLKLRESGYMLFVSFSFVFLLFLLCDSMLRHLRKCIHYMRVREVIYVLETANMAVKIGDKTLLDDLINKETYSENKPNGCKDCKKLNTVYLTESVSSA
ncbi:MAG: hypothetical protein HQK92_03765 [Nitrospirae bacterium]|nr:hypothetical protein [Nitrospirota bacterium]